MSAREPLTDRQARVYRAILAHYAAHGVPPTIREICRAMGYASPNGAVAHLRPIAAKGWIVYETHEQGKGSKSRAIEVPAITAAIRAAVAELVKELDTEGGGNG